MQSIQIAVRRSGLGATRRIDRWWLAPVTTALGLIVFFGYLTVRAFDATHVWYDLPGVDGRHSGPEYLVTPNLGLRDAKSTR